VAGILACRIRRHLAVRLEAGRYGSERWPLLRTRKRDLNFRDYSAGFFFVIVCVA
jgi:hypothetical protein